MSKVTDEAEILRETLIAEAEARAGDHPELDLLAAYQEGALEAEAEEGIRDHLVGCRRCAEQLLELRQLMPPDAPRKGVADVEIESAWRRFQALVGAEARARPAGRPSWAMAAAASLAVAALALGLWGAGLQQANKALQQEVAELSSPVVNLPSFYLSETTRGTEARGLEIVVPPEADSFVLLFPVVEVEPAGEYAVEFVDDRRGEVVLEARGLVMSDTGNLHLGLRRGTLPAGEYRVVRKALVGDSWRPVAQHRRTIRYPVGPATGTRADERTPASSAAGGGRPVGREGER